MKKIIMLLALLQSSCAMANWVYMDDMAAITTNKNGYSAVLQAGKDELLIFFTAPALACVTNSESLIAKNARIRVNNEVILADVQCLGKGIAAFVPVGHYQGMVGALFHFESSVRVEFNRYDSETYSAIGYQAQNDRVFDSWAKIRK
ncbi:hypothetical protein HC723_11100 [Vibrio sp. S11_S32]|uniref:hypothetical protein n=1 Tax=Vibrio sp. S11_S32 TaxID=2720225 RepID=UPI001680B231|nr:hypothetical protein [Vibrio sp. S11_S32]MBD1576976.1 hypothetical protein [Vibrio sp. S11_S32]